MKIGTKVMGVDSDGKFIGYIASIDDSLLYPYGVVKDMEHIGKTFLELGDSEFRVYNLEDLTELKDTMSLSDYQAQSKRTLNQSLTKEQTVSNMIMGILGETGEVADIIKKHYYQGHDLDIEHIKEEIGDVMFYIVNLCNVFDLDLEVLLRQNHTKLMKRYPNGFNEKDSIERDKKEG